MSKSRNAGSDGDGGGGVEKKNAAGTYNEHTMSVQELCNKFKTSIAADVSKSVGLSVAEAAERLHSDGPNMLTPPRQMSFLERLFRVIFMDAFMIMLLLAAVLTLVSYFLAPEDATNLYLTAALVLIVALTSALTMYQEGKASDVMAGFQNMLPAGALVLRGSSKRRVQCTSLVRGDIVFLETGDKVPADLRMLQVSSLKCDNSSLTGESLPISMSVQAASQDALEAHNLAFSGTLSVEGTGIGVVIRTGDASYVGSIAALASSTSNEKSTLTKEIERFVHFVAAIALIQSCIVFGVALVRNGTSMSAIVDSIITAFIVVILANVPQGLPSAVAGCLTVAAVNLAKRNVYVKSLNSIETLGSVSVIASDKTGTLTQNQMTVTSVWLNEKSKMVNALHRIEDDEGGKSHPLDDALSAMIFTSGVCNMASPAQQSDDVVIEEAVLGTSKNDSIIRSKRRMASTSMIFSGRDMPGAAINPNAINDDSPRREPIKAKALTGNASDVALYVFADTQGQVSVESTRELWRQVFIVPFSSSRKWMLVVMAPPLSFPDQSRIMCVKGAPERVLGRCTRILLNGGERPLSKSSHESFEKANAKYMTQGRRVLALACRRLPQDQFPSNLDAQIERARFQNLFDKNDLVPEPESITEASGLVMIGCTALEDPPKESVPGAVLRCREAGIRVIMVTGDHPATAQAIAKQCNIMGLYKTKEDVQRTRSKMLTNLVHVDDNDQEIGGVVVTGKELNSFSDADWERVLCKPEIVFARTSPHDKLAIVSRLQARGEIVAVTGDGVNDSPALKKADVGVAMGISGSEVAKDAGDLILMDDEFMSLVAGIEQGRVIFDNLTKVVAYTLTHLLPELVAVVLGIALGMPYGMSSLMILSIDLMTEMGPSLALSYEKAEDIIMERPPRDLKKDCLVSNPLLFYAYIIAGTIETTVCVFAYLGVFWAHNVNIADLVNSKVFQDDKSPPYTTTSGQILSAAQQLNVVANAQTAFYCTLVLGQFWHIWMCKTRVVSVFVHGIFANVVMDMGVLVSLGFMFTLTYVPFMQNVFNSAINDQAYFFLPSLVTLALLWGWNEIRKMIFRAYPDSKFAYFFAW